jgi:chromosome condensin MukBEF complex kleisin-like MukF subunit
MAFYALRRDPIEVRSILDSIDMSSKITNNEQKSFKIVLEESPWRDYVSSIIQCKNTYFAVVNLKEISERFRKERSFLMNSQRE